MASENLTGKVVEKVELAAEVGTKVANMVANAFEQTVADTDQSPTNEPETWVSYVASFGIHVAMVIIVILLKWQYGKICIREMLPKHHSIFVALQIAIDIAIRKGHVTGEISKTLCRSIERNEKIYLCWLTIIQICVQWWPMWVV